MEDAIKSIKAYLYDRDSSPLTGAYLIIWCIWNFRLLLIIFSSDSISIKFVNIEYYLFQPSYFFDYSCIFGPIWVYVMPLILALLYLLALPHFSLKIYEKTLEHRKKLNEKKQAIENQVLLTKEESIKIRRETYRAAEEYEEEIRKKDELISDLRYRLEEINRKDQEKMEFVTNEQLTENKKMEIPELSSEAKIILKEASLDSHGTVMYLRYSDGVELSSNNRDFLKGKERREIAKWESALRELIDQDLLIERGHNGNTYEITDIGYKIADKIILG